MALLPIPQGSNRNPILAANTDVRSHENGLFASPAPHTSTLEDVMAKLIMVWLFGAAVFALGNVYAASPDKPTDEDAIGTRAEITLIQAILDDEDEDEDLQDDEDLQEDQDDLDSEGDAQDEEDEGDQEDSSRPWTTPT
jgi:hypothetical protein